MRTRHFWVGTLLGAWLAPVTLEACNLPQASNGVPATVAAWAVGAQPLEGLGNRHREISSRQPEARRYFNQGLQLLWAFNHDEATRSFAAAAHADPVCAICYWGVALTVGPNYNLPALAAPRAKVAWEALLLARAAAANASPVEQGLIAALAARYRSDAPLEGEPLARAARDYADAMLKLAEQYRDDLDVQTLAAEALMNVAPWKLWLADGTPAADTPRILTMLEGVLARDPRHPGANHYYVHAIEASPQPERGLVAAERLTGMMPGAGHLEHMPAHILQRVGRYNDAAAANRNGVDADLKYLEKTTPLDYYGIYTAHNYQFLAYSALMAGKSREALEAARQLRALMSEDLLRAAPGYDWYAAQSYAVQMRFQQWPALLAEAEPSAELPGLHAGYLHARASALAATGKLAEARGVLAQLETEVARIPADYGAGLNRLVDVMRVAVPEAKARIAMAEGRAPVAVELLRAAVAAEDALAYDEPRAWFIPVRQVLGEVLLGAGSAREAAAVFREDLARNPENGWSLFGLQAALNAVHDETAAREVDKRLAAAWQYADYPLGANPASGARPSN
jgi:hypothetical protein